MSENEKLNKKQLREDETRQADYKKGYSKLYDNHYKATKLLMTIDELNTMREIFAEKGSSRGAYLYAKMVITNNHPNVEDEKVREFYKDVVEPYVARYVQEKVDERLTRRDNIPVLKKGGNRGKVDHKVEVSSGLKLSNEKENGYTPIAVKLDDWKGDKCQLKLIYYNREQKDAQIKVENGIILPIFTCDDTQRTIILICGQSGSGKTTLACKLALIYNYQFPNNKIRCYSVKDSDKSIDEKLESLDYERVNVEKDPLTDFDELENSLVILDDYETVSRKTAENIKLLRDKLLNVGRQKKISVIIISHLINSNDRNFGRAIVNETTFFCISPNSAMKQRVYFYDKYMNFDKKEINDLVNDPHKWIIVNNNSERVIFKTDSVYKKGTNSEILAYREKAYS
jgi:energy-coupling factor transporter ATP-binding protein EcfA2